MKIRSVRANNHKRVFEVATARGVLDFPYAEADPSPSPSDPIVDVYIDPELAREGITYILRSGAEGSVHIDWVLDYNEDPTYLRDALLYKLTVEAQKRIKASRVSRNEILRRTRTSASQLARLLDPTNTTKSIDKMIVLLAALGCEVDLALRPAEPGKRAAVV